MQYALERLRRARVRVLIACLWLALGAPAGAQTAAPLALAPAEADPALAPIALGFDRWLESGLRTTGREVVALPASGAAGLDAAARRGAAHALIPRLRAESGRVEVRLALHAPATGQLIAASRGEAQLAVIGTACAAAFTGLAGALGIDASATSPPLPSDLASATRALELEADGRLLAAWRAVEGKLSPVALGVREAIAARARRAADPPAERARVLAASGDATTAWGLVASAANLELDEPDPAVLLAAAEIQLLRANASLALRFLEAAEPRAPDSADLQLAIAQARIAQGQRPAARAALVRAAELAADDPRPLELLIEIDAEQPSALAADSLEAGARVARRLEADLARRHWQRAAQLEPSLAARAALQLGDFESWIGRPLEALAAYREAERIGEQGPELWFGIGRAQRATGDAPGAERSLRRAVELAPQHAPALVELGALLVESDRAAEAVPLLRAAREIRPSEPNTSLMLARALRLTGANADAVEVLATGGTIDDVRALREIARSQQAAGDLDAARVSLTRAVQLEPDHAGAREQLADVLDAAGDPRGAASERAFSARLSGSDADAESPSAAVLHRVDFDAMIVSFANGVREANRKRVIHLGVREPGDWRTWLRRLTRPREPDAGAVVHALREAIEGRFAHAAHVDTDLSALESDIDRLYAFERQASLSADLIARTNGALGIDGMFVTRLLAHPHDRPGAACDSGTFALETRLLLGSEAEYVQIFAATDCVLGGLDEWGRWNLEAFVGYALLALFVGFPLLRGWGTVAVRIRLPDKTKGFVSIHITKRSDQVAQKTVDRKTGREKIRAKRRFDFLRRFERHMAGRETIFRWIPAHRTDYTVTVGGPLLDAAGKEIIGHFLEEQKIRVRRRAVNQLDFDFRRRECAIAVKVSENGRPVASARVSVAGDPSSLRYARDGMVFLYLGKGAHTILVGSKDAVAEFPVLVASFEAAIPLHVDLGDCPVIFRGCAAAVEPYLVGDLATAADALDAAGDGSTARRLRAELLQRQGRVTDAAAELEAVGDLGHAAALRATSADHSGSAALYEQSGDLARAAAAHREAGAWAEAGRCYETAYDYGNALECWREAGDEERELDLLEKLGEYQDAAQIARSRGDLDRAIANLQLVDARHPDYRHTCRVIAEIVSERGDHELAVAKFAEALGPQGQSSASIDVLESYASILVRAGRHAEAVSTYETIQRRDVARTDLTTRIQQLRSEIEATAARSAQRAAAPVGESRYELLEEIGRGGMGVVYKARDKRLGRLIALKRLPENLRDHPTAVQLFEREARAAAALNHPNIVTIHDAGEENGSYFITMELLEGRGLSEILQRRGRLTVRDTARIGTQIAAGLQYAHERRIVHRDIKTSNLFFTKDMLVKIMDFGIAKSLEEVRRSTTVVGGTPYYMAPEQARGQRVDHRADLYAFGVTLFQLATGALPFSEGDVAFLHAHEPPTDPREIEMSIPAPLAELILRMMAKQPDARPSQAAEVGESLRAIAAAPR